MRVDDALTFHAHTEAAFQGYKCLSQLTNLRHRHYGPSIYTALHLIKTAFLPKMLWAPLPWWTGSQHIPNRLEPVLSISFVRKDTRPGKRTLAERGGRPFMLSFRLNGSAPLSSADERNEANAPL